MSHTPGPWKVGSWYDGRLAIVVADDYSIVAELTGAKREHEANARLIAASPTLYDFVIKKALDGDNEAKATLDLLNLPY